MFVIAVIVAPARSRRSVMTLSTVGTNPCMIPEPHVIGTPATAMASLRPIRFPLRGPSKFALT